MGSADSAESKDDVPRAVVGHRGRQLPHLSGRQDERGRHAYDRTARHVDKERLCVADNVAVLEVRVVAGFLGIDGYGERRHVEVRRDVDRDHSGVVIIRHNRADQVWRVHLDPALGRRAKVVRDCRGDLGAAARGDDRLGLRQFDGRARAEVGGCGYGNDLFNRVAVAVVKRDGDVGRAGEASIGGELQRAGLGTVQDVHAGQEDVSQGPVIAVRAGLADLLEDVHPADDLAEDYVTAVQPCRGVFGDEELAVACVGPGIGERQHADALEAQGWVERVSQIGQRAVAGAIAVGGVAGLDHEVVDHAVDQHIRIERVGRNVHRAVGVVTRGRQADEPLHGRQGLVGVSLEKLDRDVAYRRDSVAGGEMQHRQYGGGRLIVWRRDCNQGIGTDGGNGQGVAVGVVAVDANGKPACARG